MTTTTKTKPISVDEVADRARETAERVQDVTRKSTLTYLDSYERAVASFGELQVKAAKATKAPFLVDLAEAQAELSRELAAAGAGAARALLED